jgi:hypothetical protein
MKNVKWLVTILITLVVSLLPVAVLADTTAVVNVTNSPYFSKGITSFTITYIKDTQMDLTWTVDDTVANVMVRAKLGSYPDDIPDENTAPSDGYLVYYGSDLSVSDTAVNLDAGALNIYYKAWAQKISPEGMKAGTKESDGTWYVATTVGYKESVEMVLIALIGFGCVMSYFAIKNRNMMIAVIASAIWVCLIAYTRANPIGNMVTGDTSDTIILVVFLAVTIAVPLVSWQFTRQDRRREDMEAGNLEEAKESKNRKDYSTVVGANKNVNLTHMSDADYAEVLRGRRNRRK